ncbi:unnamed protein product [Somion occarium]|uniref:F-box domain-containing protein n=1 Tax=Somion occarium TaxID=3059160 RepID=A0ABP1DKB2_9APHY
MAYTMNPAVTRNYPRFPVELIERMIDYLHDEPITLAACSVVGRIWHIPARLHLFSEVVVTNDRGGFEFEQFAAALETIPHLSKFLRSLHFIGSRSYGLNVRKDFGRDDQLPRITSRLIACILNKCDRLGSINFQAVYFGQSPGDGQQIFSSTVKSAATLQHLTFNSPGPSLREDHALDKLAPLFPSWSDSIRSQLRLFVMLAMGGTLHLLVKDGLDTENPIFTIAELVQEDNFTVSSAMSHILAQGQVPLHRIEKLTIPISFRNVDSFHPSLFGMASPNLMNIGISFGELYKIPNLQLQHMLTVGYGFIGPLWSWNLYDLKACPSLRSCTFHFDWAFGEQSWIVSWMAAIRILDSLPVEIVEITFSVIAFETSNHPPNLKEHKSIPYHQLNQALRRFPNLEAANVIVHPTISAAHGSLHQQQDDVHLLIATLKLWKPLLPLMCDLYMVDSKSRVVLHLRNEKGKRVSWRLRPGVRDSTIYADLIENGFGHRCGWPSDGLDPGSSMLYYAKANLASFV